MNLDLDFHAQVEADIFKIHEYLGVSKDFDIETGTPTAYVTFELQPEAREWGIKYISVWVKKITCSIEWEAESSELSEQGKQKLINVGGTENRNETITGIIDIDSSKKFKGKEWNINCNVEFKADGGLQINDVQIDMEFIDITVS